MPHPFVTLLGKSVQTIARLRGGGSALPGLVVEKIDRHFIKDTLAQLEKGVVVISGTNGKTTTTKMVVELLESQGLKVFTNRTGSNFTRGIAAALLGSMKLDGSLEADIAVLELDEAHAVHFVRAVPPTHSLILNVMRDQLDRFGEIDATAKLLEQIAAATTRTVVLNREDVRISSIAANLVVQRVEYFGLSPDLLQQFPTDDELYASRKKLSKILPASVTLESIDGTAATFSIDNKMYTTELKINGLYNVFNAAAALTLAKAIIGDSDDRSLVTALANVTPAFGRGETLTVGGQPLEIVLVKNPSGFRLGLQSFPANGYATMIAINDNYADGRDMSWLWDVDFKSLKAGGVAEVSGLRCYDMALRLQYDEIPLQHVEADVDTALRHFIAQNTTSPKRVYATYTAMLKIRRELSKIVTVETVS